MKRILISAVLALALAGTTAFASQTKSAPAKPAASAATNMTGSTAKKHVTKKHRRHAKAKAKAATTTTPKKP